MSKMRSSKSNRLQQARERQENLNEEIDFKKSVQEHIDSFLRARNAMPDDIDPSEMDDLMFEIMEQLEKENDGNFNSNIEDHLEAEINNDQNIQEEYDLWYEEAQNIDFTLMCPFCKDGLMKLEDLTNTISCHSSAGELRSQCSINGLNLSKLDALVDPMSSESTIMSVFQDALADVHTSHVRGGCDLQPQFRKEVETDRVHAFCEHCGFQSEVC